MFLVLWKASPLGSNGDDRRQQDASEALRNAKASPKGRAFRGVGLQKKLFMNAISLAARAGTASSRRTGRTGWGRVRSISKPPL